MALLGAATSNGTLYSLNTTQAGYGDGYHRGSGQRESPADVVHGVLPFFLACAGGRG
jgi:hypothetical protein